MLNWYKPPNESNSKIIAFVRRPGSNKYPVKSQNKLEDLERSLNNEEFKRKILYVLFNARHFVYDKLRYNPITKEYNNSTEKTTENFKNDFQLFALLTDMHLMYTSISKLFFNVFVMAYLSERIIEKQLQSYKQFVEFFKEKVKTQDGSFVIDLINKYDKLRLLLFGKDLLSRISEEDPRMKHITNMVFVYLKTYVFRKLNINKEGTDLEVDVRDVSKRTDVYKKLIQTI